MSQTPVQLWASHLRIETSRCGGCAFDSTVYEIILHFALKSIEASSHQDDSRGRAECTEYEYGVALESGQTLKYGPRPRSRFTVFEADRLMLRRYRVPACGVTAPVSPFTHNL